MRRAKARKRNQPPRQRNNQNATGNCHTRMYRSESRGCAPLALYDHAKQEESAYSESVGEEKVQPFHETAHPPSRNQIICNRRPPNAVPLSDAPIARCRAVASTSPPRRSITRTP